MPRWERRVVSYAIPQNRQPYLDNALRFRKPADIRTSQVMSESDRVCQMSWRKSVIATTFQTVSVPPLVGRFRYSPAVVPTLI